MQERCILSPQEISITEEWDSSHTTASDAHEVKVEISLERRAGTYTHWKGSIYAHDLRERACCVLARACLGK